MICGIMYVVVYCYILEVFIDKVNLQIGILVIGFLFFVLTAKLSSDL